MIVVFWGCISLASINLTGQKNMGVTRHYAYIQEFYKMSGKKWMVIQASEAVALIKAKKPVAANADYVEMLTGKNALKAAIRNGDADTSFHDNGKIAEIYVPNDYYIVNNNNQLRRLSFSSTTKLALLNRENTGNRTIDERYKDALFEITIKNNEIVTLTEVYLP